MGVFDFVNSKRASQRRSQIPEDTPTSLDVPDSTLEPFVPIEYPEEVRLRAEIDRLKKETEELERSFQAIQAPGYDEPSAPVIPLLPAPSIIQYAPAEVNENTQLIDPRLPKRLGAKAKRPLPLEVLDIICSTEPSLPTLAKLALLNKSSYNTVIPYLYRSVPFNRTTAPLIFWGITLPETNRFRYTPPRITDGKVHPAPGTEERRLWCLSLIREIRMDDLLPEHNFCQSLAALAKDAKEGKQRDKPWFENVHRLIIGSEAMHGLIWWLRGTKPLQLDMFTQEEISQYHPLLNILDFMVKPDIIEFPSGYMSTLSEYMHIEGKEGGLDRYNQQGRDVVAYILRKVDAKHVIYHGITTEYVAVTPGYQVTIHWTPPSKVTAISFVERNAQIHAALQIHPPLLPCTFRIIGAGILGDKTTKEKELETQDTLRTKLGQQSDLGAAIMQGVLESIEWYTGEQGATGLDGGCGCYREKTIRRIWLESGWYNGRPTAPGVTRGVWHKASSTVNWF